jgi:PIN domain nuclease of toxin-antitoxin system
MADDTLQDQRYVLDACALIAYFNDEVGAEKVEELLERARQGEAQLYVAAVNAYEVYYDSLKRDAGQAQQLLEDVYAMPLTMVEPLDRSLMQSAGEFKTKHRISLADSIALGLSRRFDALLVSSDHHEFDTIEREGIVQFWWIR